MSDGISHGWKMMGASPQKKLQRIIEALSIEIRIWKESGDDERFLSESKKIFKILEDDYFNRTT